MQSAGPLPVHMLTFCANAYARNSSVVSIRRWRTRLCALPYISRTICVPAHIRCRHWRSAPLLSYRLQQLELALSAARCSGRLPSYTGDICARIYRYPGRTPKKASRSASGGGGTLCALAYRQFHARWDRFAGARKSRFSPFKIESTSHVENQVIHRRLIGIESVRLCRRIAKRGRADPAASACARSAKSNAGYPDRARRCAVQSGFGSDQNSGQIAESNRAGAVSRGGTHRAHGVHPG